TRATSVPRLGHSAASQEGDGVRNAATFTRLRRRSQTYFRSRHEPKTYLRSWQAYFRHSERARPLGCAVPPTRKARVLQRAFVHRLGVVYGLLPGAEQAGPFDRALSPGHVGISELSLDECELLTTDL